jgi:DNA invertase Pin-like site-specific DNA recombinase
MAGKIYGYARCSTFQQHEDRQVIALQQFGVQEKNIVVEKVSGKSFDQPLYRRLLEKLNPDDTLVILSIDRLGRNYEDSLEQWRHITKVIGAAIVVIDMPILDTRKNDLDLTGIFIADLVLQILSYLAEQEYTLSRQRQADGIAAAKAKGVKFGRKPKERSPLYDSLRESWKRDEISAREASKRLGISHTTFLVWAREQQ